VTGGRLYLRREYFGAILFDPRDGKYYRLDRPQRERLIATAAPDRPPGQLAAALGPIGRPRDRAARTARLAVIENPTVRPDILSAPLKVFFNITKRCNLFCGHCFNDSGHAASPELDLPTLRRTLRALARRGIFKVTLAGGEPMYHPDFDALIDALADTDLAVSIVTNGICITRRRAERLAQCRNLRSITLSLDGANAYSNDFVRGEKSFERACAGARRLTGVFPGTVALRLTLMRTNCTEVADYAALAAALGIREIKVNPINPYGRAQGRGDLLLSREAYRAARQRLYEAAAARGIAVEVPAHKYQKDRDDQVGLCRAGEETCEIDGDGAVYPCSFSFGRFRAGNVRTTPFGTILQNLQHHTINNSWCYRCKGRGGKAEKVFGRVPDLVHLAPAPAEAASPEHS